VESQFFEQAGLETDNFIVHLFGDLLIIDSYGKHFHLGKFMYTIEIPLTLATR
jgi:hypothetical protein